MRAKGIRVACNEELEFLGDAVLELVISEELFNKHSKNGEGTLTRMRQILVCENTLAAVANEVNLGVYLNVGTGEEQSDLRNRPKVLADAMEAVIAAVYLDDREYGGLGNYRSVVIDLFEKYIRNVNNGVIYDYKTTLQQFVEKNADSELKYDYSEEGPEHMKSFTATAFINNNKVGVGIGRTKRLAEMKAAEAALKLFGIIDR
jgi:ribonuclease-3